MLTEDEVKRESLQRAREAHVTVYLTLTSIVQGAVLAYLLSFVSLHSSQITLIGWILTSVTFMLIIITWNEYVMGVITFRWVPDLMDSCIPFMFGASQYVLVNAINDDPTKWIFRFIAFSSVSFLAFRNMYSKATHEDGHNAVVLAALGAFVRINSVLPIIGIILSLAFMCITFFVGSCAPFTITATGIIVVSACGYTIRTWLYWRRFVTFARDDNQQLKLPFLSLQAPAREGDHPSGQGGASGESAT
jgi:hypothetical protein